MKSGILLSVSAVLTAASVTAATDVASISARQDWPWSPRVYIDFTMPAGTNDVDLVAEFDYDGRRVSESLMGEGVVGGSVYCLAGGAHRVIWDPVAAGYTNSIGKLEISATAVSASEREWLVLDCETGDYRYVAHGDEEKNANGWPWATASNVNTYRQRYMVFRRIPAGKYQIGWTSPEIAYLNGLKTGGDDVTAVPTRREVELTSDFYIGIHQVTLAQNARWYTPRKADYIFNMTSPHAGDWSARGYHCFARGSNTVDGINWPSTKFRVKPGCNIAQARTKFKGRFRIDLPTAAQWMCAARPSADWLWYDTPSYGGGTVDDTLDTIKNILNTISRGFRTQTECNSQGYGNVSAYGGIAPGRFQPNAFGIYDVIANRREMVLDGWSDVATMVSETVDPVGPSLTGNMKRVFLNSYAQDFISNSNPVNALPGRVYSADNDKAPSQTDEGAFRFVIHLNPPQSFGGRWE